MSFLELTLVSRRRVALAGTLLLIGGGLDHSLNYHRREPHTRLQRLKRDNKRTWFPNLFGYLQPCSELRHCYPTSISDIRVREVSERDTLALERLDSQERHRSQAVCPCNLGGRGCKHPCRSVVSSLLSGRHFCKCRRGCRCCARCGSPYDLRPSPNSSHLNVQVHSRAASVLLTSPGCLCSGSKLSLADRKLLRHGLWRNGENGSLPPLPVGNRFRCLHNGRP